MNITAKDRPVALGLELSVEGCTKVRDPSFDDIVDAIFLLDPSEGVGIARLAEVDDFGDYVQVAGGYDPEADDKRYCVERRVYVRTPDDRIASLGDYEHLVAGYADAGPYNRYPDADPHGLTSVKTNGFKVDCKTTEVLFLQDALAILLAFLEARGLPEDFQWRSNRAEIDRVGGRLKN